MSQHLKLEANYVSAFTKEGFEFNSKPLSLVNSNESIPKKISTRSFLQHASELNSNLVYSDIESIKEDVPYFPYMFSLNGTHFRTIYKNLKTSITELQNLVPIVLATTYEEYLEKKDTLLQRVLERLHRQMEKNGSARVFIDAVAHLEQDACGVAFNLKNYPYGAYGKYIEKYNVRANSYYYDLNNMLGEGVQFLAPNILLESSIRFTEEDEITAESLFPRLFEQEKKSYQALLELLEGILPAYEAVMSDDLNKMTVDLSVPV